MTTTAPFLRIIRLLAGLAIACALGGCAAGFNESFACNQVGGVKGCATMTDIHARIDQGRIPAQRRTSAHAGRPRLDRNKEDQTSAPVFDVRQPQKASPPPQRTTERVQKLVVFPYVDDAQTYHDTSVIYVLVEPPRWKNNPAHVGEDTT